MSINYSLLLDNVTRMKKYFKVRNIPKLRSLSNDFNRDLLIFQDPLFLDLSLSVLVLSNVLEKPRFWKYNDWLKIVFEVEEKIELCSKHIRSKDIGNLRRCLKDIIEIGCSVEDKDKRFVESIITHGRVKIGSTLYAQGLSIGKASEIAGVSKEKIFQYSGKTLINDRFGKTMSIKERINNVRSIFRN
jgi:hypothetical protein